MKKTVRTSLTIVYTGGGTSGHRAPLIAVHQALRKLVPNLHAFYIGTKLDANSVDITTLKKSNVKIFNIDAGKFRRYWTWQNIADLAKIWRGFWQARRILKNIKPDILFAKGGFVTVPVVMAASFLKIPIISHESDVVMGLANKLNAKKAVKVCTAYPVEYYRGVNKSKLIKTGNLIRQELVDAAKSKFSTKNLKIGGRTLLADKPVLVIFGGSQGAHRINELIVSLLPVFINKYRIIHQTGSGDIEWLNQKRLELSKDEQKSYFPIDFINSEQLGEVLRAASLVISRAGSMVSELALFALPTILIPLSSSAGGHQLRNAMVFANKKAAKIIKEEGLTARQLASEVEHILSDPKIQQQMIAAMKQVREESGAKLVAELIVKHAK